MGGFFVTGTDTGVGKTRVAGGLAAVLSAAVADKHHGSPQAALWKPVQTGTHIGDHDADSFRLRVESGLDLSEQSIVAETFPDPLAPWMAARRVGAEIDYNRLVRIGREMLAASLLLIVEGAGGLLVPITSRKTMADLAKDLVLPLVIVARTGLGTVNHTLLTVSHARAAGLDVLGVILNGFADRSDPRLAENAAMIEQFADTSVLGMLPWLPRPSEDDGQLAKWRSAWTSAIEREIDLTGMTAQIG